MSDDERRELRDEVGLREYVMVTSFLAHPTCFVEERGKRVEQYYAQFAEEQITFGDEPIEYEGSWSFGEGPPRPRPFECGVRQNGLIDLSLYLTLKNADADALASDVLREAKRAFQEVVEELLEIADPDNLTKKEVMELLEIRLATWSGLL
jgi:hypothetical protein